MSRSSPIKITFQPNGKRIEMPIGATLLSAAQLAGIDLIAACGGFGICGTCQVRVIQGKANNPENLEIGNLGDKKLKAGYRLACMCIPESDASVEIPEGSLPDGQKFQIEGLAKEIQFLPAVTAYDLDIDPPDLNDLRSDFSRIKDALIAKGVTNLEPDALFLDTISEKTREFEWNFRAAIQTTGKNSHLVGIFPPNSDLLGVAADIGSTKIAVYLVNLLTGATIAQKGFSNPQISFGEDVINRIGFANKTFQNRALLQKREIESINEILEDLCRASNKSPDQIVEAVLVGNTAIHHLTCLFPVRQLGSAPYVAAISDPIELHSRDLGLVSSPGARVYLPAIIGGFVGSDHTSALLATRFEQKTGVRVLIDIGTNTEISLGFNGDIYSCSTASGPAFEGAHIRDGMRAAPGAIEKVLITAGAIKIETVGGTPPVGICGTGILQIISELLRNDIITNRGGFRKNQPGVVTREGRGAFLLVPGDKSGHGREIIITRKDINEIQLAKAAIRAGIEILFKVAGITSEEVQEWIIAGAFGTYLNLESAVRIGMFPNVSLDRFSQVGNAAGTGAKLMLLSREEREMAQNIAKNVKYIDLTSYPDFTDRYIEFMNF